MSEQKKYVVQVLVERHYGSLEPRDEYLNHAGPYTKLYGNLQSQVENAHLFDTPQDASRAAGQWHRDVASQKMKHEGGGLHFPTTYLQVREVKVVNNPTVVFAD